MKNYVIVFFFLLFAGLGSMSAQVRTDDNSSENEMDNFVLNDAVTMYPNPVKNFLFIRSSYPITRVQVFSLLGNLVKDEFGDIDRINMSSMNSGIYMIKIYSNQFFVTKKLIKK